MNYLPNRFQSDHIWNLNIVYTPIEILGGIGGRVGLICFLHLESADILALRMHKQSHPPVN